MDDATIARLRAAIEPLPGLRLAVLHGSRARGDEHAGSDWDVAFLADEAFDPGELHVALSTALGTDRVDLADLRRAGVLLRHRVARDGVVLLERPAGAFAAFQEETSLFWCEVEPVLRRAWNEVLAGLGS